MLSLSQQALAQVRIQTQTPANSDTVIDRKEWLFNFNTDVFSDTENINRQNTNNFHWNIFHKPIGRSYLSDSKSNVTNLGIQFYGFLDTGQTNTPWQESVDWATAEDSTIVSGYFRGIRDRETAQPYEFVVELTGLNPQKTYDLAMIFARSAINTPNIVTINNRQIDVPLRVKGNYVRKRISRYGHLSPDENGTLRIAIRPKGDNRFVYLNAMQLMESIAPVLHDPSQPYDQSYISGFFTPFKVATVRDSTGLKQVFQFNNNILLPTQEAYLSVTDLYGRDTQKVHLGDQQIFNGQQAHVFNNEDFTQIFLPYQPQRYRMHISKRIIFGDFFQQFYARYGGAPNNFAANVQAYAQQGIESGEFDYASVYVRRGMRTLLDQSYGDWGDNLDGRIASYHFASNTKPMAAAMIWRLHDKGLLNVDHTIDRYLPFLRDSRPRLRNEGDWLLRYPTIRELLTHSGGLPRNFNKSLCRSDSTPLLVCMENWFARENQGWYHQPGEVQRYAGAGIDLLGAIAEKISGKNIRQLLKEEVFEPLGMKTSLIASRDKTGNSRANNYWGSYFSNTGFGSAAGGAEGTMHDLAAFGHFLLYGFSKDWRPYVSFPTLREMISAKDERGCWSGTAMKFSTIDDRLILIHGGSSGTVLLVDREREIVIAVAANRNKVADENGRKRSTTYYRKLAYFIHRQLRPQRRSMNYFPLIMPRHQPDHIIGRINTNVNRITGDAGVYTCR